MARIAATLFVALLPLVTSTSRADDPKPGAGLSPVLSPELLDAISKHTGPTFPYKYEGSSNAAVAVVQLAQELYDDLLTNPDADLADMGSYGDLFTDNAIEIDSQGIRSGQKSIVAALRKSREDYMNLRKSGLRITLASKNNPPRTMSTGAMAFTSNLTVFATRNGSTAKTEFTAVYVVVPFNKKDRVAVFTLTQKQSQQPEQSRSTDAQIESLQKASDQATQNVLNILDSVK